ncbi:MAG: glycosyl transferase group 1 [Fibrobacteres bacterium]|nr:glycosyl transferase group 1 [Fibrobacterota bacterium]
MSVTLRNVARNIVHFLCSNAVSFVLGMAASVVMARSLGPNDLGIFHQVSWFAGTVSVIISLGFITSITKFTAQFRSQGRDADVLSAVRYIFYIELAIAIVTTIALLCYASSIADHYFSKDQKWIFMLAFIAITPGIQTAIFSATLEGAQVFRYQTVHSLTVTPAALLLKVYVMMKGYGLISLFGINLLFSVVNLGFFYYAARREGLLKGWFKFKPSDGNWKKEILAYNKSAIGIHFVDLVVWSRSENYFLGRYCLAPQIAYYNLAQNLIVKFTGTLPNLMWRILLPLSAEHHGRNETEKMKKTYHHALRYSAFIVFPTVAICFLAAYELIVIFYGHAYSEAKDCFQILCAGALLSSLAQPGSAVIYASNRQNFILKYGAVLAVLNIALCFWLVPKYGARGAAFCYSFTTSLGVIGGFIFTTRKMDLPIPWPAWLKCAGATALMCVAMSWLLKIETGYFTLFQPTQMVLMDWTGHDFDLLLGARAVRLIFACAVSGVAYLTLTLFLFKPKDDDRRILAAMHKFLPRPVSWYLERKLPAGSGIR